MTGLDEQESNELNDFTFRFDPQNFFHENDNMMQSLPDTDVNSWLEVKVVQHLSDPQAQTWANSQGQQPTAHRHSHCPSFVEEVNNNTNVQKALSHRENFPRDKWQTDDPEVIKKKTKKSFICLHINIQVSTQTHTDNLCNRLQHWCEQPDHADVLPEQH